MIIVHGFNETGEIVAAIDGSLYFIPDDMANGHRRMIAEWEGEGNTIPPYQPPPPPVPQEISDRQFFQELANMDLITEEEAEDAVASGTVPAAMLALVDQLPEGQRFGARMLLKGATTFERAHPITATIGQIFGIDSAAIDELWRRAKAL
ncbi:hypothetical protein J2045_003332 [Peteryoungia aggregata LMG 23059]|uniref:Uncharacterized protein n=1 Tax=Peteryoungia aggregata LMG 23059 TaxID=1368425 RepID=A0ABU0GA98_9HYPH|nr:hypothetical protein [Peteryoungia aggregata]MDQ0422284.1 hypothetical protein [Peteryoungia aggregata LMG 23059]